MQFSQPIFTSLSPNTEKDDIWLALKLILKPWKWKKGKAIEGLEKDLAEYLGVKHTFAFNSGRSAFLAILNSLDLEQGSGVLLQAFTCNALVNPIIWSSLKPVFVDIREETLNIDTEDLKRKIGSKSKAVVVQHTFGLPADLDEIIKICEENNLILIEDCAHSLGAVYKYAENGSRHIRRAGTFGKASFFSFGRDKIISSVYGGMAVTNDDKLAEKIKKYQEKCSQPFYFWIFQQLLHPILCNFLIIPLYRFFGIGRYFLIGFQKLKILSKAVHKKEKQGKKPAYIPQKMPNALAILGLHQFKKLDKFISHQRKVANFYTQNLLNWTSSELVPLDGGGKGRVYMRYPILIQDSNTDEILKKARKQNIFLNDGWRKSVIVPLDTNQEKMQYISDDCPVAEKVAKNILNLPTHINISEEKAKKIINFLKQAIIKR